MSVSQNYMILLKKFYQQIAYFHYLNLYRNTCHFIIGSIPLLKNIGDTDDDSNHIQAFGVIQGLAGSGKSYVINSWKALALSWGQEYAVQCTCPTGIAASNILGKTIDSLLCSGNKKLAASIKLLVIDEVNELLLL